MSNDLSVPPPVNSIADVIAALKTIDTALESLDGLKWFNFLYLAVTQAVDAQVSIAGGFSDPAWIATLDVAFANLYLNALRIAAAQSGPQRVAPAWRPLLENRKKPKVARIQFALSGMNAHINRDLVFALLGLYQHEGVAPDKASPRFADFLRVNTLIEAEEVRLRPTLLVGTPLEHGGQFGPLEDLIANFGIKEAREAAWNHSLAAWHLRSVPAIQTDMLNALDGATELGSSMLLAPVLP